MMGLPAIFTAAVLVAIIMVELPCAEAKTMIELCSGSDSCLALLGYTLYTDMKVSEVVVLFANDPSALDFAAPGAAHRILPLGLFLRVPMRCAGADGVRRSVAVLYVAHPANTLATITDIVFAGLASADQICGANGLTNADADAPLEATSSRDPQTPPIRLGGAPQIPKALQHVTLKCPSDSGGRWSWHLVRLDKHGVACE
ncbi:lysM domain-containing GPI-anchored protein LYP6-like [Triticum dicoccoides]|uniref:lysM domain-containing GPI-anchored protein LYP6-like n=1 Tax=Triticum dicoccoides TaxID=85692 RepID=UPI001890D6F1|nr:lysM domain-containing GPI-anchored protein LYP6-like [Triticum dicoccoides]